MSEPRQILSAGSRRSDKIKTQESEKKKPRMQEPQAMFNTSEPMSKVMSPDELEVAIKKLQEDDKLRIDSKKEKKNPK